jgi:uncharacterized protein (DUF1697 family)
MNRYVAFLRGINVGGHHKVPMARLRQEMKTLGYKNVITLLNSGNIIFEAPDGQMERLEDSISGHLEQVFGFSVPVILRRADEILDLIANDPFKVVNITDDIRLYILFLKHMPDQVPELPWKSEDNSCRILEIRGKNIFSVFDISITKTPKGMEELEKLFGKEITTRNRNTIQRIVKKSNKLV